ncbi:hypothetical protein [Aliivibrio fischeri]|uniref:hypothetical protein n=1 Tax=Aliivibrio fischeri TaxID=668 RepID=UPI00084CAB89|nr:hypothetical protein [Aliivibrio fischeri]OED57233.1 hypothetical protein BEI47_11540 [Aliivibrio fischeri]
MNTLKKNSILTISLMLFSFNSLADDFYIITESVTDNSILFELSTKYPENADTIDYFKRKIFTNNEGMREITFLPLPKYNNTIFWVSAKEQYSNNSNEASSICKNLKQFDRAWHSPSVFEFNNAQANREETFTSLMEQLSDRNAGMGSGYLEGGEWYYVGNTGLGAADSNMQSNLGSNKPTICIADK